MGIVETIEMCAQLLASVGEPYWSMKLSTFAETAKEPLNSNEVEEAMSWFGGMGSLSDVLISAINGHDVQPNQEDKLNSRLDELRSAIHAGIRRYKGYRA